MKNVAHAGGRGQHRKGSILATNGGNCMLTANLGNYKILALYQTLIYSDFTPWHTLATLQGPVGTFSSAKITL